MSRLFCFLGASFFRELLFAKALFQQWDEAILLWIQEFLRYPLLTPFFQFFTHLGDHAELWLALLLMLWLSSQIGLTQKRNGRLAIIGALSLAITFMIVNLWLKESVARIRPYQVIDGLQRLIEAPTDFSFPSGHSASSMAVAFVLFRRMALKYGGPILGLAGVMAFSRLYLGVHYLSDVLVGLAIGMVVAEIVVRLTDRFVNRPANQPPKSKMVD